MLFSLVAPPSSTSELAPISSWPVPESAPATTRRPPFVASKTPLLVSPPEPFRVEARSADVGVDRAAVAQREAARADDAGALNRRAVGVGQRVPVASQERGAAPGLQSDHAAARQRDVAAEIDDCVADAEPSIRNVPLSISAVQLRRGAAAGGVGGARRDRHAVEVRGADGLHEPAAGRVQRAADDRRPRR